MAKNVDLELKRAFAELQMKMIDTTQKLKLLDVQIESLKRNVQHARLTEKELSLLDPKVPTYESLGRMFILEGQKNVRDNLKSKMATCEEKVAALENSKAYLERSLKDSENNLREMVQSRKSNQENA